MHGKFWFAQISVNEKLSFWMAFQDAFAQSLTSHDTKKISKHPLLSRKYEGDDIPPKQVANRVAKEIVSTIFVVRDQGMSQFDGTNRIGDVFVRCPTDSALVEGRDGFDKLRFYKSGQYWKHVPFGIVDQTVNSISITNALKDRLHQ